MLIECVLLKLIDFDCVHNCQHAKNVVKMVTPHLIERIWDSTTSTPLNVLDVLSNTWNYILTFKVQIATVSPFAILPRY